MAIETLLRTAGRPGEVAGLNWDGINWDVEFTAPFIPVAQTKVAKMKIIALVAGATRHDCWILNLADFLTLCIQKPYKTDEPAWVFSELHEVKYSGSKLGAWMQALVPGGDTDYADVAVESLPEGTTAGGIRPGAINRLAARMPAEFVAHNTGHELKSASSMYEYMDADLALCIPGALVSAGWPQAPWGQLGRSPVPPALEALKECSVTVAALQIAIDKTFNIDSASAPQLHVGGTLRPLIHAAYATLLMYHEDRLSAVPIEMRSVGAKLEAMLLKYARATFKPGASVRQTILAWGRTIALRFSSDNAPTVASSEGALMHMGESIRNIGCTMSDLKTMVASQGLAIAGLTNLVAAQSAQISALMQHISGAPEAIAIPAATLPDAPLIGTASGQQGPDEQVVEAVVEAVPETSDGMGSLLPDSAVDAGWETAFAEMTADQVYLRCWENGHDNHIAQCLNDNQVGRAKLILDWFDAALTAEERATMSDRDAESGMKRHIAEALQQVVRRRLAKEFRQRTRKVPTSLRDGKSLTSSSIESRLSELRNLKLPAEKVKLTAADADLPAFRAGAGEEGAPSDAAETSAQPPGKRARTADGGTPGSGSGGSGSIWNFLTRGSS